MNMQKESMLRPRVFHALSLGRLKTLTLLCLDVVGRQSAEAMIAGPCIPAEVHVPLLLSQRGSPLDKGLRYRVFICMHVLLSEHV